jgi:hypothetical protein
MADKSLYGRLKKIFSIGSYTIKKKDGRLDVFDFDERQTTNLSMLRDKYTKIQKSAYVQAGNVQSMAYQQVRREVFRDYDAMDNDPIIASALDIYADESTLKNEFDEVLKITSDNQKVIDELHNLFYDVLNVEFNLWSWVRNLCKYGDFFLSLEISDTYGIVNCTPHTVYNTQRLEMTDPNNPNFVRFKIEEDPLGKIDYDNYEIAHFRLLSDTNWLPYGKSMIENGRRLWKQLSLMEDAMLIHRIMRAPEKRLFKIDIGGIPPTEVDNYMQKIINKMKKVPFMDKNTGDYNLKFNIQNLTEDFFMPVRGGDSGTNIENLSGLEYSAIDDIDYLKAKMFAALKIPKAYLGYEENVSGKATLAAEDVRFARTIERIQRTVVSELSKIAVIHLYSLGFSQKDVLNFDLSLVNPSTIYEQEKVNLWTEKVRLASDMIALKMISKEWIFKNIFNMSNDELYEQRAKVITDLLEAFRHNTIEQEGNDPSKKSEDTDDTDMETGESGIEPNKPKGGRPPEGNTYGKDKHPYGRDPLGDKENRSKMTRQSESSLLKSLTKLKSKNRLLRD